ncbi:hypothetical protein HDR59_03830 [bacterium]|nr:hypothetical protein [bacterium]
MTRAKRLLTICFASIYLCVIYADSLLSATKKSSAKKSSSSKKKSSNKNKGKRAMAPSATKALNNMMQNVEVQETGTSTQTTTAETSVAETTNNETASTETASESVEINIELTDEQLYKTVPSHEKWEDFKFCMQQQCMGGPEQPANVECYKSLNFDNAFQSCKIMIGDASKYSIFEKYFKEDFLREEQAAACADLFAGNWNAEKKTCDVAITYTRKYESKAKMLKNSRVGCNDNKTKVVSIPTNGSSVKLNCSYEVFGLSACYSDSAEQKGNEIGMVIGGVTAGVGLLAGVASGVVAATQKTTETKAIKDKETGKVIGSETVVKQKEVKDRKTGEVKLKDETAGAWAGISAGLQAGQGMVLQGVGQMVTAGVSKNDVGEPVLGTCKLPDNVTYSEGSYMELGW